MLPASEHAGLLRLAIDRRAHFACCSYVSEPILAEVAAAEAAGLVVLTEACLDPGIDHLFADLLVAAARAAVGDVAATASFTSYCGGVPAVPNEFRYRFSWAPHGVLSALCAPARYIDGGMRQIADKPWEATRAHVLGGETFEVYPNRDSIPYITRYSIPGAWRLATFVRGTLRLAGWRQVWADVFAELRGGDSARITALADELAARYPTTDADLDRVVLAVALSVRGDNGISWSGEYLLDVTGEAAQSAMARCVSLPLACGVIEILAGRMPAGLHQAAHGAPDARRWLAFLRQAGISWRFRESGTPGAPGPGPPGRSGTHRRGDCIVNELTKADKPRAFILTGSFPVIRRNPLYLTELSHRGLKILVITAAAYRAQAAAAIADISNPASQITEIAYVTGDFTVQGAFVAGAVAHASAWRQRYHIVGAYAVGDYLAEPTGLLCDGLNVRSPGLRASRACRSKYLQRWYLPEYSPASLVIPAGERSTASLDGVVFPAVVKPAGRASSSGVVTVTDPAGLRGQLASYAEHEVVLIERKVAGPEFSVESLVQDGQVIFASATGKDTTDSLASTFVELAHSVPTARADLRGALLAANGELLQRLAFHSGIAHSEWRVPADGRPVLMEVAARTPGDGLLVLYQLATGYPMEPEILRVALGEPASYPPPRRYARQVYLEHEAGVLDDVTVSWPGVEPEWISDSGVWPEIKPGQPEDEPTLRAVLVLKQRGSELVTLSDSDDRSVTFFIDAASPAELDELEQRVRAAIRISSQP